MSFVNMSSNGKWPAFVSHFFSQRTIKYLILHSATHPHIYTPMLVSYIAAMVALGHADRSEACRIKCLTKGHKERDREQEFAPVTHPLWDKPLPPELCLPRSKLWEILVPVIKQDVTLIIVQ